MPRSLASSAHRALTTRLDLAGEWPLPYLDSVVALDNLTWQNVGTEAGPGVVPARGHRGCRRSLAGVACGCPPAPLNRSLCQYTAQTIGPRPATRSTSSSATAIGR